MPEFQLDVVRTKSRACESLCGWVRALFEHARLLRRMAPQAAKRKMMETKVKECREHLREVCMQEELAQVRFEDGKRKVEENRQETDDVTAQLRLMDVQEREATNTVNQTEFHIAIWNARKKVQSKIISAYHSIIVKTGLICQALL